MKNHEFKALGRVATILLVPLLGTLLLFQNCGAPFQSSSASLSSESGVPLDLTNATLELVDTVDGKDVRLGESDVAIARIPYKLQLTIAQLSQLSWSLSSDPQQACVFDERIQGDSGTRTLICYEAAQVEVIVEGAGPDGKLVTKKLARAFTAFEDALSVGQELVQERCSLCHAQGDQKIQNMSAADFYAALKAQPVMSATPNVASVTSGQLRLMVLALADDPEAGLPEVPEPPPSETEEGGLVSLEVATVSAFAEDQIAVAVNVAEGSASCQAQVAAENANIVQVENPNFAVTAGTATQLQLKIGELIDHNAPQHVDVQLACSGGQNLALKVRALPRGLAISFGTHHACALREDKTLYCWGKGTDGQLGDPQMRELSTAYQVPTDLKFEIIRAGTQNNCGLATDGNVYCWGLNTAGVLGTGDNNMRNGPSTKVIGLPATSRVVDIGLSNARDLFQYHLSVPNAGSPAHACALMENGEVWCWGSNNMAQLGRAGVQSSNVALKVEGVSDAVALAVGAGHNCVITKEERKVYCWGGNHGSQLGSGTNNSTSVTPVALNYNQKVRLVAAGGGYSCLIDVDDKLLCWGRNVANELGKGAASQNEPNPVPVANLTTAAGVYPGKIHTCAISKDKRLYCWGDNYSGQLANGGINNGTTASATLVNAVPNAAVAAAAGSNSSCALLASNKLQCWGHGYFGETGGNRTRADFTNPADVVNFLFRLPN